MNIIACVALACTATLLVAGCGRPADEEQVAASNFVPPVVQPPTPVPGQGQSTPLTAYVGHYPNDAVDGVTFFDRTEVANALVDVEPDARIRRLVTGRDVTAVPIFAAGPRIAAHGCEPHNCGDHHWTLLIATDGDRNKAAICVHDAATMGAASRWSTRAGVEKRAGDCPTA